MPAPGTAQLFINIKQRFNRERGRNKTLSYAQRVEQPLNNRPACAVRAPPARHAMGRASRSTGTLPATGPQHPPGLTKTNKPTQNPELNSTVDAPAAGVLGKPPLFGVFAGVLTRLLPAAITKAPPGRCCLAAPAGERNWRDWSRWEAPSRCFILSVEPGTMRQRPPGREAVRAPRSPPLISADSPNELTGSPLPTNILTSQLQYLQGRGARPRAVTSQRGRLPPACRPSRAPSGCRRRRNRGG